MSDTYETKRDEAAAKQTSGYLDGERALAEYNWKAGADWSLAEFMKLECVLNILEQKQDLEAQLKIAEDKQQYYLHSDDNYYWTPAAWAEYQSLKAKLDTSEAESADLMRIIRERRDKLEIAKDALDEILHAGNMAMQGKWDDTEIMKNLAYAALVKLNQPMSTEGDV